MFLNHIRVFTLALLCSAGGLAQITLNQLPTREVGHPLMPSNPFNVATVNPNLVEGREFAAPSGIALDNSVTPPRIYVADSQNNRVLAWKDASGFTNGKPADLVLGQRDFYSTFANGPGRNPNSPLSSGFAVPTGLAVFQGDLYVADSGNNRVLRFRKPFAATDQVPDLVLGQPSLNSAGPNYPGGQVNSPTDKGLALSNNNGVFTVAITFDTSGNLWLTDAGNNRVLRYAANDIKNNNVFAPTPDREIGQLDFFSRQPNLALNGVGRLTLNQLATPSAIAFDTLGRLYIADADSGQPEALSRVMVFSPPFTTGMSASRIMGIPPTQATGGPALTDQQIFSVSMRSPGAVFFLPGNQGIGVVDSFYHRILIFDTYDQWPDVATATSPSAKFVVGHSSGVSGIKSTDTKSLNANDGNPLPSTSTFSSPQAAVFFNNELYVADSGNNRVVVMPLQNGTFGPATRVLGQDRFNTSSVNLIEGREFFFNGGVGSDSAIALDSTGDVPHLYISDPYNNRVLGFRDVRSLKAGSAADIVIGQPDLATAVCNYPQGNINAPTQSSLCRPLGLLVDSNGNLYVSDSLNGRVLRFPTPFSHQGNQVADLVLGKSDFTSPPFTDATSRNMYIPYGLAFAGNNGLLVSDQNLNRVLFIPFTNGGFTSADNGKAATKVFGQTDFTSSLKGTNDTGMSSPHHIGSDTDGRPYIVDSGNGRVLIFDQVLNNPNTGAHAAYILGGVGNTEGIFVNQNTGEVWVTDRSGAVRKFPRYDQLVFNPAPTVTIASIGPVAVLQDQYGDLIVAESTNRVTFYYPALASVNGASFQANFALAPNTIAAVFPQGITFGKDSANAFDQPKPLPLPTVLADLQVTVNGTPAPLYAVTPGQINFIVPWSTDTGNPADVQVLRVSTGQLLAASQVAMNTVSPALFVGRQVGQGAYLAAVINGDQITVNDPTHPAKRGDIIQIFGTGQGPVSNTPADGDIPKNGLSTANGSLRIILGPDYTDQITKLPGEENRKPYEFSGLSPNYPGMWQVNVQVPMSLPPGPNAIALQLNSVGTNNPAVVGYRMVFYVAQ